MELKDYLILLRKWGWLIVAATLVAMASSFLVTRQQPFIYSARATLMVGRAIQGTNPQDYEITASQQLGQKYANLAGRRTIKEGVQAALGRSGLPGYTAGMVPNAHLLEIQVVATDPERAAANDVVNQLILQTSAEQRDLQRRRNYLNRQLRDCLKSL
jgi:capsular polysaccharide biosynthesis protein